MGFLFRLCGRRLQIILFRNNSADGKRIYIEGGMIQYARGTAAIQSNIKEEKKCARN